ncbi:MAG: T9SS type A sorting domain-containing protein, partial [Bacteroidota bacterium]|nr:T9SS type A sorting domain-containing protein [Bacteroidota bacterium]
CYTDQGTTASFQNILQTDTVKACYDVYIYSADTSYFCHVCDSLLYDGNSWELLNTGNPTSVEETVSVLTSAFYPNPANEIIYFDYYLNKPAKLIMMDILGNQVKMIQLLGEGKHKINISDLSKGIYFGNVIVNNEIVTIKKIIVR